MKVILNVSWMDTDEWIPHGVTLPLTKSVNVCEVKRTSMKKHSGYFFHVHSFHMIESDIKHSLTPTHFPQSFQINKTSCSIRNFMNKLRCIDVVSHGPAWCVLWGCVCYGMCIFSTFLGYYTLPHHRKSSGVSQEQTLIHQKWVCVIM